MRGGHAWLLWGGLLSVGIIAALAAWLSRRMTGPLERLARAAERMQGHARCGNLGSAPSNGQRPVSASYIMLPTAYQSAAGRHGFSMACSGAM